MPDNKYNTQTVSSILPEQQSVEAENQTTGLSPEPTEPISAEDETGITPSPVYEALYGNHEAETTETIIPYNKNETPPISTITETPEIQPEATTEKPKPATPVGEIAGSQKVKTGDELTSLADFTEELFNENVNKQHGVSN